LQRDRKDGVNVQSWYNRVLSEWLVWKEVKTVEGKGRGGEESKEKKGREKRRKERKKLGERKESGKERAKQIEIWAE
jgi:hypothetical protein